MKTKLRITRKKKLISTKNVVDEKGLGAVFYMQIHNQRYQNTIECYTET